MHIWLSQSLDIPNSTVCISLLEQIFEFQKSFWWAAFINNVVIFITKFQGLELFIYTVSTWKPAYYVFEVLKSQAIFQK